MSRREYTINLRCAEPGCAEWSFSIAETRQEERETRARYAKSPWRCTRHTRPDEVLSIDSPVRDTVLEVRELFYASGRLLGGEEKSLGMYWCKPGEETGSGFTSGPGYKAFAKDFPAGTKLILTARIELPESTEEVSR